MTASVRNLTPTTNQLLTLAAAVMMLTVFVAPVSAQGNYQIIFNFGQRSNYGYQPWSGVLLDQTGNLYGNTEQGGQYGFGTVYELLHAGNNWNYITLHSFQYQDPGSNPVTTMVIDPMDHLYGTGVTAIFELTPRSSIAWHYSMLYQFTGGNDGNCEDLCSVSRNMAGNLYGSTPAGGEYDAGVIFEYSESGYHVLYNFTGADDGGYGVGQIAFDSAGNAYGTTVEGGLYGQGVVYRLSPSGVYTVLHNFAGPPDGSGPWGGLMMARDGNLYGTTAGGGSAFGQGGTVFRMTPNGDGTWTESVLYSFSQEGDGFDPMAVPTMDASGNLYGVTSCGIEPGCNGTVYKLTQSNGNWAETIIHAFQGGTSDGMGPFFAPVIIDRAGNVYGTTTQGGEYLSDGSGVVWEYTP